MSRKVESTKQFRKDYIRAQKQGKDLAALDRVMREIIAGNALDRKWRDHSLKGNHAGIRECHVAPDWLLLYRLDLEAEAVLFVRIGSHAELFR